MIQGCPLHGAASAIAGVCLTSSAHAKSMYKRCCKHDRAILQGKTRTHSLSMYPEAAPCTDTQVVQGLEWVKDNFVAPAVVVMALGGEPLHTHCDGTQPPPPPPPPPTPPPPPPQSPPALLSSLACSCPLEHHYIFMSRPCSLLTRCQHHPVLVATKPGSLMWARSAVYCTCQSHAQVSRCHHSIAGVSIGRPGMGFCVPLSALARRLARLQTRGRNNDFAAGDR